MLIVDILEKLSFPEVEHFNPDWAENFLLLEIDSTHSSSLHCKKKKGQQCIFRNSPNGPFLIQLTLYTGYQFKSLILIS